MESNKFGLNKRLSETCEFNCMNSSSCMFRAVGDCTGCELISCENCTHWDNNRGCELVQPVERTKEFFTELIMEQNEQK